MCTQKKKKMTGQVRKRNNKNSTLSLRHGKYTNYSIIGKSRVCTIIVFSFHTRKKEELFDLIKKNNKQSTLYKIMEKKEKKKKGELFKQKHIIKKDKGN